MGRSFPCPACGAALENGECPNPVCETKQEDESGDWDSTETIVTKRPIDWFAELRETVLVGNIKDPERKYTREDFERRFLGRGGNYDES